MAKERRVEAVRKCPDLYDKSDKFFKDNSMNYWLQRLLPILKNVPKYETRPFLSRCLKISTLRVACLRVNLYDELMMGRTYY